MKNRLPFLALIGVGLVLWRGAFGLLPSERTITWRFPVSYAQVRSVELQVWDGDSLLGRQEQFTPTGLTAEPQSHLALTRGPHRAVGLVHLDDGRSQSFQREFDPTTSEGLVIDFGP